MSFTHMIILAIIAVIVIPPDKLPEVARQVARFLNDIRRSTSGIWDGIQKEVTFKPSDLMKPNPTPTVPKDNIPPHQVVPNPNEIPKINTEEAKKNEQ